MVSKDWMDTEEYLSVLKVIIPKTERKTNVVQAKQNLPYRIYKRTFPKGDIEFELYFPHKKPFVNFVIFYKLDEIAGGVKESCGGEEIQISLPTSDAF